ncbi:ABC transporter permease [Salinibacterium sp. G-O1]|uniref:ABC transporter permease n=1 Tax=Salinibacterium sp. G-O1 TaxID=3046208 RepID=UPI0024BBDC08|nr:ABC transporter permease [Salinibacterium sp. G-O1]MDJ0336416.1 ABC transporter permease [Salinibacterium sp. G-O1]
MFVAWRDLRFARGRFVLIGSVVALITLLVGFLSGLTGGLAAQNISAVLALPADQLVFSAPTGDSEASFSDSTISEKQVDAWSAAPGVDRAGPVGISQGRAELGESATAVALFGTLPDFDVDTPAHNGTLVLSAAVASSLDASTGDTVSLAGSYYTVAAVGADSWYSHTAVIHMTLQDWQAYSAATGNPDAFATIIAVTGEPNWAAENEAAGTISHTTIASLTAIGSFRSEIGSLLLMVAMLFGISALVIGAFFTVWTMQRKGDIAMLKALGASTGSLVRDALGQALVVLLLGVGIGIGVVAILGALASGVLPFILSPLTTVLPGAIMIILGLAGAAFALRSVTSADPLTALGSNR